MSRSRYRDELAEWRNAKAARTTCDQVFDACLTHCEMRLAMNDMAYCTFEDYRRLLKSAWCPQLGAEAFEDVRYSRLAGIVAAYTRNKKTCNNVVSTVRCAFDFGYKDHPEKHNPASGLKTLRIRFFTGLRQSEQIALRVDDCDLTKGKNRITKVIVRGREKDRTKTREDREIRLCGRALDVLKRQFALREQFMLAGKLKHDFAFCQEDGHPIQNLSYPDDRWRYVMEKTRIPYREPYNARHSFVSWRLMAGHNILLVAKEDGHSPHTMLTTYAAWTDGATETDVEAIRQAMERAPDLAPLRRLIRAPKGPRNPPDLPPIRHQKADLRTSPASGAA